MWCVGTLVYELLTGEKLFNDYLSLSRDNLAYYICNSNLDIDACPYLRTHSVHAKEFLKYCLKRDPKQRITAEKAL